MTYLLKDNHKGIVSVTVLGARWLTLAATSVVAGKVPASKVPTIKSHPVVVSTLVLPPNSLCTSASPQGWMGLLNTLLTCYTQGCE